MSYAQFQVMKYFLFIYFHVDLIFFFSLDLMQLILAKNKSTSIENDLYRKNLAKADFITYIGTLNVPRTAKMNNSVYSVHINYIHCTVYSVHCTVYK